jgi:hypothetical protein
MKDFDVPDHNIQNKNELMFGGLLGFSILAPPSIDIPSHMNDGFTIISSGTDSDLGGDCFLSSVNLFSHNTRKLDDVIICNQSDLIIVVDCREPMSDALYNAASPHNGPKNPSVKTKGRRLNHGQNRNPRKPDDDGIHQELAVSTKVDCQFPFSAQPRKQGPPDYVWNPVGGILYLRNDIANAKSRVITHNGPGSPVKIVFIPNQGRQLECHMKCYMVDCQLFCMNNPVPKHEVNSRMRKPKAVDICHESTPNTMVDCQMQHFARPRNQGPPRIVWVLIRRMFSPRPKLPLTNHTHSAKAFQQSLF